MNKKIGVLFLIILIIILVSGYFGIKITKANVEKKNQTQEYIPEEEITDKQVRQTIINLYFQAKDNNELVIEARLIDIKEIINNASDKLINLLIEGPKNDKNSRLIPEDTKLNKTYFDGDCIVIDFSEKLLNFDKEEGKKELMIKSIVNTLTELTEVNKVKILINGQENEEFNETYTRK